MWPRMTLSGFFRAGTSKFFWAAFENNCVKANKDKHILSAHWAQECMTWTLGSGNVRFMRIFAGVSLRTREREQTTLGGRKRRFFSTFGIYIFGSFRVKANIIIHCYLVSHWFSTDPQKDDIEWSWMTILRLWPWLFCTICGRIGRGGSSTSQMGGPR